jgi:hypothetical protein
MAMWPERDERQQHQHQPQPYRTPATPSTASDELSDGERDRMVALLRMHCTEGRISLDEFSDRVGLVYGARSTQELDRLVYDLPVPWRDEPAPSPVPAFAFGNKSKSKDKDKDKERAPRRPVRWLVAVFSQSTKSGRFRLDDDSVAVALFGECTIDLSDALIDAPSVNLAAVSVFGQVNVIVPEGIHVELEGIAVFGDRRFDVSGEPPVPGSPVIVVKAYACFGEVRVRSRRAGRS